MTTMTIGGMIVTMREEVGLEVSSSSPLFCCAAAWGRAAVEALIAGEGAIICTAIANMGRFMGATGSDQDTVGVVVGAEEASVPGPRMVLGAMDAAGMVAMVDTGAVAVGDGAVVVDSGGEVAVLGATTWCVSKQSVNFQLTASSP